MGTGARILLVLDLALALAVTLRGLASVYRLESGGALRAVYGALALGALAIFLVFQGSAVDGPAARPSGAGLEFSTRADLALAYLSGLVVLAGWMFLEAARRLGRSTRAGFRVVGKTILLAGCVAGLAHAALLVVAGEALWVRERLRGPLEPTRAGSEPNRIRLESIAGYPAIDVAVNGERLRMIVDTGSDGTVLTREAAGRIGGGGPLVWSRVLPVTVRFPLYGRTQEAEIHRFETLEVGDFEYRRVYVPAGDFGKFVRLGDGFHGFVGMDLLAPLVATFDRGRAELVLSRSAGADPPADAAVLSVESSGSRVLAELWVALGGRSLAGRYRFLVDTGVSRTALDPSLLESLGPDRRSDASLVLHFGPRHAFDVGLSYQVLALPTDDGRFVHGILGHDVLDDFRMTLDMSRGRIWFEEARQGAATK